MKTWSRVAEEIRAIDSSRRPDRVTMLTNNSNRPSNVLLEELASANRQCQKKVRGSCSESREGKGDLGYNARCLRNPHCRCSRSRCCRSCSFGKCSFFNAGLTTEECVIEKKEISNPKCHHAFGEEWVEWCIQLYENIKKKLMNRFPDKGYSFCVQTSSFSDLFGYWISVYYYLIYY